MNDENYIDRSQFLPRGEPMITPEREAKGDIFVERNEHGNINFARGHREMIVNYLLEIGVIDDQQFHDAGTFQIWRDMHQVSMGLRRAVSSGGEQATGVRLRAYGFILLCKRLTSASYGVLLSASDLFANEAQQIIARNRKQTYRTAFKELSSVLPAIHDAINALEALNQKQQLLFQSIESF